MVHDPRAPRLAASATLVAAVLVLLTALNLVFGVIGSTGVSEEEIAALAAVPFLLLVANLANKQREVPELVSSAEHQDAERFEFATSPSSSQVQTEVNPTTASILTSILGEQRTSDQSQVNSAINTLASGAFGESVQRTMDAIDEANQTNIAPREAAPADETTGQTLQRVIVQPLPLPGKEHEPSRDPTTIPGLEPNRVFITQGVASVPLPTQLEQQPASTSIPVNAGDENTPSSPSVPEALDLPDLNDLPLFDDESIPPPSPIVPEPLDLPDLGDLFPSETSTSLPSTATTLPDLPDLDDLF